MCSIQHARVDWEAGNWFIAATATYAAPTRVFGIFARCLRNRTQIYSTYTLRQTYVYIRNRTPVIRNLTRGYANFIRHKYACQPTQILRLFHEYAAGVRRSTRIISA